MKVLAIVLGIVFAIAALLAVTGSAHFSHLLGFDGHRHLKHTVLYAILALLCFGWARMAPATPVR